jgi:hypothetical protein
MDPVTIGAVLLAVVSGVGSQLGTQLWEGIVSLVRRPLHHEAAAALQVPSGEAELTALQQAPSDQHKAVALAEAMLARSGADDEFRRALESWWQEAEPIRASLSIGNVANTISGGAQSGPVLQGRDFSKISFGASPPPPQGPPSSPVPPSSGQGAP